MNSSDGLPGILDTLQWLEQSALAQTIRGGTWTYAGLEALHLIGLGCLAGSMIAFDLRLMGRGQHLAVRSMARYLLPIAVFGFLLAAGSGALMFMADAVALSTNLAFQVKLVLILLAGLNALACHWGPLASAAQWDEHVRPPRAAAIMGLCSLVLWLAVILCGRLIAYV